MNIPLLKTFKSAFLFTGVGFALSLVVGAFYHQELSGASLLGALAQAFFTVFLLSLLEISISFDNAVVNATILKDMDPIWKKRFLTWGILLAVFGMRLIFPVALVAIIGDMSPWSALVLASTSPDKYAQMMLSIHHQISAFGGTFLLLVSLKYFLDTQKTVHWIAWIEAPLAKAGKLEALEIGLVLVLIYSLSLWVPQAEKLPVIYSCWGGLLTFLFVEGLNTFLKLPSDSGTLARIGAGTFIYLEVLDASFSFDGVVGAFAISNNLFLIALGLGIGAFYVRSFTLYLIERGTLAEYLFLEHGAFYAIGSLAVIMYLNIFYAIPEIITGVIGLAFIGLAILESRNHSRQENKAKI